MKEFEFTDDILKRMDEVADAHVLKLEKEVKKREYFRLVRRKNVLQEVVTLLKKEEFICDTDIENYPNEYPFLLEECTFLADDFFHCGDVFGLLFQEPNAKVEHNAIAIQFGEDIIVCRKFVFFNGGYSFHLASKEDIIPYVIPSQFFLYHEAILEEKELAPIFLHHTALWLRKQPEYVPTSSYHSHLYAIHGHTVQLQSQLSLLFLSFLEEQEKQN